MLVNSKQIINLTYKNTIQTYKKIINQLTFKKIVYIMIFNNKNNKKKIGGLYGRITNLRTIKEKIPQNR